MTEFRKLNQLRIEYATRVDWFIRTQIARGAPRHLYKAATHLFEAGGKRFRPFVVLATASMLGGFKAEERALPFAASVELFHTYTLIHDDIMDEDEFRRGVPTTHKIWGVPLAILAGDLDYALSFKSIFLIKNIFSETTDLFENSTIDANALANKALETLIDASIKIAEGQALDMYFEKTFEVSYKDYLEMIYLKTGALIEASAKLGAIAAIVNEEIESLMAAYGRMIGIAFQIRDDILGIFGDPEKTGKPIYNDLRRGKKTILVLYALEHADAQKKDLLLKVLRGDARSEESVRRAAEIIEETGALAYAEKVAKDLVEAAKGILEKLDEEGEVENKSAYEALHELASFTIMREK